MSGVQGWMMIEGQALLQEQALRRPTEGSKA